MSYNTNRQLAVVAAAGVVATVGLLAYKNLIS